MSLGSREKHEVVDVLVDMPRTGANQAAVAELVRPLRIEDVFDDPLAIRRMVEDHGPYPAMARYLPESDLRGAQAPSAEGVLPHFRGNWAAAGEPAGRRG
jgi:hypothetical protein